MTYADAELLRTPHQLAERLQNPPSTRSLTELPESNPMLSRLLREGRICADRPAMVLPGGTTPWAELADLAGGLADRLSLLAGRRVGVAMQATPVCLASLAALDEMACDVFLLDGQQDAVASGQLARDLSLDALVHWTGDSVPADANIQMLEDQGHGRGGSTVTILTSGSTGRPKAACYTWQGLARPVRRMPPGQGPRWLLAYRVHLYAGLQVVLQCLVNHGTLVTAAEHAEPDAIARVMRDGRVQYASATPSYWRRLILLADRQLLGQVPLEQITLGGEIVDESILAALKEVFPEARMVHIYATTELGRCFSVTDGRAGFPVRLLDCRTSDGVEIRLADGELQVRSPNAMLHYDPCYSGSETATRQLAEGWVQGDLVEVRGDRVHFVGRTSEIINVGGNKVHPQEVERAIRQVPGVVDARVYGRSSSLAGQLVACQIVARDAVNPVQLRQAVSAHCSLTLGSYQQPRIIDMVDRIELTEAGKIARQIPGEPDHSS